jgi:prophage tail gpP-like protein
LSEPDTISVQVYDRDDPSKVAVKVDHWESYDIDNPPPWEGAAGTFSLTPSPTPAIFDALKDSEGSKIEIMEGDSLQFTGIIEDTDGGSTPDGKTLTLTGRDMSLFLVDSAAPRMSLKGYTFKRLIEALLQPWYPDFINGIHNNNAVNSYRMMGYRRGHKDYHKFGHLMGFSKKDPPLQSKELRAVYFKDKKTYSSPYGGYDAEAGVHEWGYGVGTKIQFKKRSGGWAVRGGKNSPEFRGLDDEVLKRIRGGERVKDVIDQLAKQVACMSFMTADAYFCVTRPRYNVRPYSKLKFKVGHQGEVKAVNRRKSIADRHSIHWATGKGRTSKSKKGRDASHRIGCVDPSPAFWRFTEGASVYAQEMTERLYKPTIMEARRGSRDEKMLRRMVRTKMEESIVKSFQYEIQVKGHRNNGLLWQPDTNIELQEDVFGFDGELYVSGRRFVKEINGGTSTVLRATVPDVYLAVDHDEMSDDDYANYLHRMVNF